MTTAPGVLILVVVPSGSVSVRLTRTAPAGCSGRQSMPSRSSSTTNGSSLCAGSTAIVGTLAATAAREMFTPLPPAWEVTDSARSTAPRTSSPVSDTVRSMLGLGVRVTIMRPPPRRRDARSAARSASLMPASVTTTSMSASWAKRTMCSWPILEESTRTTTWWAAPTIARLAAASAGSGVLRPWSADSPLVPTKATSALQQAERRHRVLADGGVGGRADPAGQQVQVDAGGARPAARRSGRRW